MLSVLIPVYNYNIFDFVKKLQIQCDNEKIVYEIIVIEDGSSEKFNNSEVEKLKNTEYLILENNIGRAKIRNLLAEKSNYDNLLFIDCDSDIENDYIKNYVNYIKNSKFKIIYGGRKYTPELTDRKYSLHWKYGSLIESKDYKTRLKNPNKSFMTNNFLIKKDIFNRIKFNENIIGYGHEDTLFGIELLKNNITITHIANPVIHIGLDDNSEFIEKTLISLKNLKYIYNSFDNKQILINNINLLRFYYSHKILTVIIYIFFNTFKNKIIYNLKSDNPNLKYFNIFKIANFYLLNKK